MADNYKIPPLLPVPLIVLMVASAALPVIAFLMVYQTNAKEIDRLKVETQKKEKERQVLLDRANQRREIEFHADNYRVLKNAFELRFFKDAPAAQRFWEYLFAIEPAGLLMGSNKPYRVQALDEEEDGLRDSMIAEFEQEYVTSLTVTGTHRALLRFLIDLYNARRTVYFPQAASVRVTLPKQIPGLEYLQLKADDAKRNREPTPPGFYFEPINDATGEPLEYPEEFEAAIETGTLPRVGNLWYVGYGLDETTLENMRSEAPGDKDWAESLKYVFDQMQLHYDPDQSGRPFSGGLSVFENRAVDPRTGGRPLPHQLPVFFYIEHFRIVPVEWVALDRHKLEIKLVFPIRTRSADADPDGGDDDDAN